MKNTKLVIFDLDGTMYDYERYVRSGFNQLSFFIQTKFKKDSVKVYEYLIKRYLEKGSLYNSLFNDMVKEFNIDEDHIEEFINVFYSSYPNIELYKDAKKFALFLKKRNIKIAIATNSSSRKSKERVEKLNIKNIFNKVYFSDDLGYSKPHPHIYEKIMTDFKASPESTIVIGDNPLLDFPGAEVLGIQTIRLMRGEFKDLRYEASCEIDNFNELIEMMS